MSVSVSASHAARGRRSARLAAGGGLVALLGLAVAAGPGLARPDDPPPARARVPDALPSGGKETFVDLPARGEDRPGVAGVNFGPADDKPGPGKKAPRGKTKIKSGGKLVDDPLPEKPPEGWQEYVQEKYKAYSIWLPKSGRKLLQKEGVLDLKTIKVGFVVLRCEIDDNVTVNVQRLIIPLKPGEKIDATTAIEMFRDVHLEDVNGTATQEFDLMLGTMPGKEYRVDLPDGEKSRVRIYQIGRAVWRIWLTGTKEQVEGKDAKLILASFKNQLLIKDGFKKDPPPKKKP